MAKVNLENCQGIISNNSLYNNINSRVTLNTLVTEKHKH